MSFIHGSRHARASSPAARITACRTNWHQACDGMAAVGDLERLPCRHFFQVPTRVLAQFADPYSHVPTPTSSCPEIRDHAHAVIQHNRVHANNTETGRTRNLKSAKSVGRMNNTGFYGSTDPSVGWVLM